MGHELMHPFPVDTPLKDIFLMGLLTKPKAVHMCET